MDMKEIIESFPMGQSFTKQQFRNTVLENNNAYSDSSISWLLSELKREQKITSIGYGTYIRKPSRKNYSYMHTEDFLKIEGMIDSEYPLVEFQMWEIYQMNEFVNHLFGKNTIFVEVEHMCEDVVFDFIHNIYPYVLFCPNKEIYYRQRSGDDTVVVQKLISESPKPTHNHCATLEKILVDLFSSKLTGKLISRGEYPSLYEDAFAAYNIDERKMFRYARRRNIEKDILDFINNETNIVLNYPK